LWAVPYPFVGFALIVGLAADQFREFNPNVLGAVCVAEPSGVFGTVYNLYIYVNVDN